MADGIPCPSGLTGRVRSMKAREERVLADPKLAKNSEQNDKLLAACGRRRSTPGLTCSPPLGTAPRSRCPTPARRSRTSC